MQLPGDFSSDAQFFVFTGVLSFLATMAIMVVYVFFSEIYFSESKMAPMIVSKVTTMGTNPNVKIYQSSTDIKTNTEF